MSCKPFYKGQQFDSLRELARFLENEEEVWLQDVSAEEYFMGEFEDDNMLIPDFERKIKQLKNSRQRVQQRLGILRQQKLRESTNASVLREVIKEENKLHGFLDEIEDSLITLRKRDNFAELYAEIEKDINKLEKLVESENDLDLEEARELINFYTSIRPYRENNYDNPFFSEDQIYDEKDNLTPEFKEFFDIYQKYIDRADVQRKRLEDSEKAKVIKTVNEDKRVTETFGKKLTKEEILSEEQGLRDINILSAFFMDPEFQFGLTNSGVNGILAQISKVVLEDMNLNERQFANYTNQKLKAMEIPLKESLTKLTERGVFGNLDWNIFRKKTKNGNYEDTMIRRFTENLKKEEDELIKEIYTTLHNIRKEENPKVREANIKNLRIRVYNWYKERVIFLDFRKIGSIINDEKFSGLFEGREDLKQDLEYEEYLKSILGENGFNEEIEKQKIKLKEYIVRLQFFHEDNMHLNEEEYQKEMKEFKEKHDPFVFLETSDNFEKNKIPPFIINYDRDLFVHKIPRRYEINSTKETGYYDKEFDKIDNDPALKEFHDLLMEFLQYLHDMIPPNERHKVNPWSLAAVEKSFIEILRSPEITILKRFSKALNELWKKLGNLFLSPLESQLTFARIDPVTGNIIDKVNTDFLKFNKHTIDKQFNNVMLSLKENLGISLLDPIGKIDLDTASPLLIVKLANILNTSADIESIKKFFSKEDFKKFNVEKAFEEAITHSVIINQTIDLPKVMRYISYAATLAVARQKALPLLNNIKKQYLSIKQTVTNDSGDELRDKEGNIIKPQKNRHYAEMQYENWFNRKVLGNHGKKIGMSPLLVEKMPKIGVRKFDDLIDKIKNKEIKEETYVVKLKELLKNLNEESEKYGGINETVLNDIKKAEKLLENTEQPKRYFSFIRTMESLFELIRWLGLGYNINTAVTNFFEGQFSNFINMNKYFSEEIFSEATDVVKYSLVRNYTFKLIKSNNSPILKEKFRKAELVRGLMDNFDVLQDAYNELQKASVQSRIQHLNKLHSKELVSRVEFLNQSPVFVAILMDTKVNDIDGNETSLWEAYLDGYEKTGTIGQFSEKFSNLSEKYLIDNNKKEVSQEIVNLKGKITSYITKFHGDYSELGGNMLADTIEGTMLLMFKKWLGSYLYNLFGIEQRNIHTGQLEKGRYKSLTAGSGTVMGATVGTVLGGLPGAVIGAGLGTFFGGNNMFSKIKRNDDTDNFTYLLDLTENFKMMMLNYIGLPIKILTSRNFKVLNYNTYKNKDYEGMYQKVDYKNIRANMAQMAIVMWLTTLLFVVKGLAWDDDDEKDSKKRKLHNIISNKLISLSDQMISFINPIHLYDSIFSKDSIAAFRFFDNVGKTLKEAIHFLEGDDLILTGTNVGESALWNQFEKTFLPSPLRGVFGDGDYMIGFNKLAERQFSTTPFDKYFHNSEYIYKNKIRKAKLEEKNRLNYYDLTEEEKEKIDFILNKKYKKEGSYEKTFKRVVGKD